ncbi:MAG: hypothetical protein ACRD37_03520, partial [Candidatus Acidiferrales bacterium]
YNQSVSFRVSTPSETFSFLSILSILGDGRLISRCGAHRMDSSLMKDFCHRKTALAPSNPCWALAFLGRENRIVKSNRKEKNES